MPPAPTDITQETLHDLLGKMAVLVAQFDRHCAQSREALQTSARQVPEQVRLSTDQQMERLHKTLSAQAGNAIERPVTRCVQQLDASSTQLQRAADVLMAQSQRAGEVHRGVVWASTGVAGIALLAILIAGMTSTRYYAGEIQRQRISADLLKAYNAADVQLCGERLCVRPEADADAQSGYVQAALR